MRILNIVSAGYRAALEEQDDTVVWICHALAGAGAPADLLLRGSAVNYLVEGQGAPRLAIGGRVQKQGPDLHGQVRALSAKGVRVFVLAEDLARYGLGPDVAAELARPVSAAGLPGFIADYDQVWHW
jgi:hypothetical protein